jgi:hypothetical protein
VSNFSLKVRGFVGVIAMPRVCKWKLLDQNQPDGKAGKGRLTLIYPQWRALLKR